MGRLQELRVVDPVLTQLAWGYKNAAMVADALFPRVYVDKEGGKIPVFGKEAFREYATLRALRANSNLMPVDARTTIDCVLDEHDLGYPIDRREGADSTFDEQKIGQGVVLNAMALQREIRAAALAFAAGNYDATNKITLSGTTQFSHASSTPIVSIEIGKAAIAADIGLEPNVMVMGKTVYNTLSQHTTLLERIKYSQLGVVTIELMKTIFDIPNIFVGSAIKTSDAGVLSYVWDDSLLLAYVAIASESNAEPSYGYTLTKRGYPQADVYTLPGGKVDVVRDTDILKEKIVGADAGYLMSDCLA
jgi:hypothetical protein